MQKIDKKYINNVVIKALKEDLSPKGDLTTKLIISKNKIVKAKIISTGNLVEGVKDGDVIHYDRHAGHNINWKDKLYTVITAKDIVLVE